MSPRYSHLTGFLTIALLSGACASGGSAPPTQAAAPAIVPPETVVVEVAAPAAGLELEPGRFDTGKMWTFENPPLDYFEEAYGFRPGQEWLDHVRLSSLRLPNCTASFVSADGLVMTNHHCGRESASAVSAEGEDLLTKGSD